MRTASDGRGEEPWEDPTTPPASADDEATRVFSRDGFAEPAPAAPAADTVPVAPAADTTREFTRSDHFAADPEHGGADDLGGGPPFTRKFVRDRPLPRAHDEDRPLYRDEPEPPPEPRTRRPEPAPPRKPRRRKRRRFRVRWLITLILIAALAIPPGTWGWVWYTARQDDRMASDAIVVLGASQYNGVPSPVFEARLRQAQVLYQDGVAPVIVTVGGKQPDDAYTEAAAGRNWLVDVGIPAEQVVAVEEGSDTLQSIDAVAQVFDERAWQTAILVSDPWHSARSKSMAASYGIDAGTSPARTGPAVIERETQLWYITRETASLWYYWIFNDSSDIRVNAA
ncbi:YdcF family protein [Nocardiopsis oceani]